MKNMKRPRALLQLLVDLDRRGHRALPFRRGNWTGNFIQSYSFHFFFQFLNSLLFFIFQSLNFYNFVFSISISLFESVNFIHFYFFIQVNIFSQFRFLNLVMLPKLLNFITLLYFIL
jgi:hypothetical protein